MASPTLITPTTQPKTPPPPSPSPIKSKLSTSTTTTANSPTPNAITRRLTTTALAAMILTPALPTLMARANDEEYVKETEEVINKVRNTISLDKNDPNVADAVAELRATSNSWVAKYRREKALLGRISFRDMYSALNAVSGHYISFGPTAPIPAKRRARILEEMNTAEKALQRGR